MHRIANPFTAVRFRSRPPTSDRKPRHGGVFRLWNRSRWLRSTPGNCSPTPGNCSPVRLLSCGIALVWDCSSVGAELAATALLQRSPPSCTGRAQVRSHSGGVLFCEDGSPVGADLAATAFYSFHPHLAQVAPRCAPTRRGVLSVGWLCCGSGPGRDRSSPAVAHLAQVAPRCAPTLGVGGVLSCGIALLWERTWPRPPSPAPTRKQPSR